MILPPPPDSPPSEETPVPASPAPLIDLCALYPACFNLKTPRPVKIGIHRDLMATGLARKSVRGALHTYCLRRAYLNKMHDGVPRIDLQGQPAGEVNADDAAAALAQLAARRIKKPKTPLDTTKPSTPPAQALPDLPLDAPLTQENIVPGRLELTVKFTELPQPLPIKSGMKIGIQTDTALVVATLPLKAWKKLVKAQTDWPQWTAAMTGKLGAQVGSDAGPVVMLDQPAVQVFEKKAKPAA